jgi:energy-coupling factor transport system permease protein
MHTLSWIAWVFMVMAVSLATTNPYYLTVVLLSVLLVSVFAPKTATGAAGLRALLFFGAGALTLSAAVSVVNGNAGSHVFFTVPGPNLPGWMGGLRLGGPVTAEGLVYNVTRGLAVLCIFVAFGVFNAAVSPIRVLRTAPAALFHAGLVVTIGLTLLPSSMEDLRRIREMQALRGMATGLRQLPGLVVPAVIGGLERSMRLAEAMEARGYAAADPPSGISRLAGTISAPLMLTASFAWLYLEGDRWLAGLTFVMGVAVLSVWLWDSTRRRKTTRFRPERFALSDRLSAIAAPLVGIFAVGARTAGLGGLGYNAFAGLAAPSFEPLGSLLALASAWPVLLLLPRGQSLSDEVLAAGSAPGAIGS